MARPERCPKCGADFDAGPIPEEHRDHYAEPYRFSRVIAMIDRDKDRQYAWHCPDCDHEWRSE